MISIDNGVQCGMNQQGPELHLASVCSPGYFSQLPLVSRIDNPLTYSSFGSYSMILAPPHAVYSEILYTIGMDCNFILWNGIPASVLALPNFCWEANILNIPFVYV